MLITGASKGIGKATAVAFAKRGALVGINYKTDDKGAEEVLHELEGEGHRLYRADVSDANAVHNLINDFCFRFWKYRYSG